MANKTTVLIADEQALYREGLSELVAKWHDFEVVGEAKNGLEAVEFCRKHQPDLVIMDVALPVMDGIEAARIITGEYPQILVVMLSLYANTEKVLAAVHANVRGYLLKNIHTRQLHNRLQAVVAGHAALSEEVAALLLDVVRRQQMIAAAAGSEAERALSLLTDHEKKILRLVALGLSNKEIGARLYVSESTVKKQLNSITSRLRLKNRTQAAMFALRSGLIG
ncbi:MAG: response regulator transcription factor [Coriobacteriales bacterium]|jgi:DNA-binding NarL/FixJ family response regulator|nr:response regulator transcription factor [Coriobacteriales bacterium]